MSEQMEVDLEWPEQDIALAETVKWMREHKKNVSWVQNCRSEEIDDTKTEWFCAVPSLTHHALAGLVELAGFGFKVDVESAEVEGGYMSIRIVRYDMRMCKMLAESKHERRVEAELRMVKIKKLADTAINRQKAEDQAELVDRLSAQARIFKMDR